MRCSTISKARPAPGSNVRSASRPKATPPKTLVQEVVAQEPGVRVFVVHSEERLAYERAQRIKAMDRVRTRLEKLRRRIVDGRLKAAEKVGAAATGCDSK